MTLGEKLRQARSDRGLSQSQTAGTYMTRNMLSQLEHDQVSPSVKTLLYLAGVLDVPVSWLLDEQADRDTLGMTAKARECLARGDDLGCLTLISSLGQTLNDEQGLLLFRSASLCAERALAEGNVEEAERFLSAAESCRSLYLTEQDRMTLDALRLWACIAKGQPEEGLLKRLQAAPTVTRVDWLTARHEALQGRLALEAGQYDQALVHLHHAEENAHLDSAERRAVYRLLELCYKNLEDYKQAYHYATLRADRN